MLRKIMVLAIVFLFVGISVVSSFNINSTVIGSENNFDVIDESYGLLSYKNQDIIFEDDFNDNIKNFSKWSEYENNGEWYEQNNRTEFHLFTYGPDNVEAIESIFIPIKISQTNSVNISIDMITEIFSTMMHGELRLIVSDGEHSISLCYLRAENICRYKDSDDNHYTNLGSHEDGVWTNTIQIYNDRYRVTMDDFDSGWINETLFIMTSKIKIQLYGLLHENFGEWHGGFDNAIVQGDQKAVAYFDWTPIHPKVGDIVNLNASYSYDPNGTIVLFEWDWDNDGFFDESSTNPLITHIWFEDGAYPVSLRVANDLNQTYIKTKQVRVGKTTFYVGGSGLFNYTFIQVAVNSAFDGDTIFVFNDSSPYYQHVTIDKSVDFIGEDRDSTIINCQSNSKGLKVNACWVNISGFTIQNSHGIDIGSNNILSKNIIITDIKLIDCSYGFYFHWCADVIVKENVILACDKGMNVRGLNISVTGNIIDAIGNVYDNGFGMYVNPHGPFDNDNINVSFNTITNYKPPYGYYGIQGYIPISCNVTFYMNEIINCSVGMEIEVDSTYNSSLLCSVDSGKITIVKKNNFRRNIFNLRRTYDESYYHVLWQQNYWGRPRLLPKLIIVLKMITGNLGMPSRFEFDLHPAFKPFDIPRIAI